MGSLYDIGNFRYKHFTFYSPCEAGRDCFPFENSTALIDTEIKMCNELLNVEPTSKWGKLHLTFLFEKKVTLLKNSNVVMTDHDSTINDINNKRKELLSGLFKTDSMHSEYYEYLLRKM